MQILLEKKNTKLSGKQEIQNCKKEKNTKFSGVQKYILAEK